MPVAFQSAQMPAPAAEMKSAPAATEAPAEPQAAAKMAEGPTPPPAPTMGAAILQDSGTGAEPYPPPAEALAASASTIAQTTATPVAPIPTSLAPEQANLAERNAVEATGAGTPASQTAWSGWRYLEVALALLVVVTVVWAFYLRRSRRL